MLLTSKIDSDRRLARVIAEICGKINKRNENFSAEIAMMTQKMFLLKLKADESFLGIFEFITMLNIHCECRKCSELLKLVIFKIFETNWCQTCEQFNMMHEFLCLNTQIIQKFPYYVNFDIIYQTKFFKNADTSTSCKTIAEFNKSCKFLSSNQLFQANPSLKVAMNYIMTDKSIDFEKIFENPKDLRILTPLISAVYFISNAIAPAYNLEDNLIQSYFASLIKFIIKHSPNDLNVKVFMKTLLDTLKTDFFTHHIKIDDIIGPELIKGTAAFISELFRHNLMDYRDYKIFLKFTIDHFMADNNEITKDCKTSIQTYGYVNFISELNNDQKIARFVQTSYTTFAASTNSNYKKGSKYKSIASLRVEKRKR